MRCVALLALLVILSAFSPPAAADKTSELTRTLGKVNFPVSCSPAAQMRFNTAVTLLHSFWYDKAEEAFRAVAAADPSCAMAYWGIAMTRWHELWAPPDAEDLGVASAAVAHAQRVGAKTDRERRFIAAIAAFYHSYNPNGDDTPNARAYADVMRGLHASYPSDRQVALFYALALIATASRTDTGLTNQRAAGAILEPIFAAEPDDPGAAHYIIHAYDNPRLAQKALHAAEEYAKIAPAVPHALHMPSHTFTDLGLWEDSIASNRAGLAAEYRNYPSERLGSSTFDDFHSTDFLGYAYLQAGRLRDARMLAADVAAARPLHSEYGTFEYALTLSRYVMERGEWKDAARFQLPAASRSLMEYLGVAAIVHYVRGVGAARSGDISAATAELRKLDSLSNEAKARHTLVRYLRIERSSLLGWIARARGQDATALTQLRSAAAEDAREYSPPPLLAWPAQEQVGYLLIELRRPAEAWQAFQQALRENPNRLRSLSGAAQAASAAGDRSAAQAYYRSIVAACPHADANLPELVRAREFASDSR